MEFVADRKRDASHVICGFYYQIQHTVLGWLELAGDERLELECGEDIDKISPRVDALTPESERILEQVKRATRPITLRSPGCVTAIAHFLDHRKSNPLQRLRFRFITTATVAKERNPPVGLKMPGIQAWEQLRKSPDAMEERDGLLQGIREILRGAPKPQKLHKDVWSGCQNFVETDSNAALLEVIQAFEWSTGEPDTDQLRERVIQCIQERGWASDSEQADRQYKALSWHVNECVIRSGSKQLTAQQRDEILNRPELSLSAQQWIAAIERAHEWLTWEHLSELSDGWRSSIRTDLDGQPPLPRTEAIQSLMAKLEAHPAVVILGESGSGKSSLVIQAVTNGGVPGRLLFFHAPEFVTVCLSRLPALYGSFESLLKTAPSERTLMCLDALEQVAPDQLKRLASLLKALAANTTTRSWRLVLSCEEHDWPRVRRVLRDERGLPPQLEEYRLTGLDDADFQSVVMKYPKLGSILAQPHLRTLLRRPKYLELLIQSAMDEVSEAALISFGESHFLREWWERYIQDPPLSSDDDLMKLAVTQANEYVTNVPYRRLLIETSALEPLRKKGIIGIRDERASIHHRLYADIARCRRLLGTASGAAELRPLLINPIWRAAVRIFALHLVEDASPPVETRALLLEVFKEDDETSSIFLDAIALNPLITTLLERHSGLLMEQDGKLLRRILARFGAKVTEPDDVQHRWPELLQWLLDHRKPELNHAPAEVLSLACRWLELTPALLDIPLRGELADLILEVVEAEIEHLQDRRSPSQVEGRLLSRALLHASAFRLERAQPLLETMAGLRVPTKAVDSPQLFRMRGDVNPIVIGILQALAPQKAESPAPRWEGGPLEAPFQHFQTEVFEGYAFQSLVNVAPEFAGRILRALMIEPPMSKARGSNWHFGDSLALAHAGGLSPSPYWHPLATLLQLRPDVGVEVVLTLVQHATDRWYRSRYKSGRQDGNLAGQIVLTVEGRKIAFLGDNDLRYWHRGLQTTYTLLATVLICLEKYLYDLADAWGITDARFTGVISQILRETRSVAVLGVLTSVAKRHPALLEGCLEPLVTSPWLILWSSIDRSTTHQEGPMFFVYAKNWSVNLQGTLLEWNALEHRWRDFYSLVWQKFLDERAGDWPTLQAAAASWISQPEAYGLEWDHRRIVDLGRHADVAHWGRGLDDAGRTIFVFEGQLPQTEEVLAEDEAIDIDIQIQYFPFRCRKILEGTEPLDRVDPAVLWKDALRLTKVWPGTIRRQPTIPRQEIVHAAAAVLVGRFEPWLISQSEILDIVRDIYRNVATDRFFQIGEVQEDRFHENHLATYLAFGLPPLWQREPAARDLRRTAAQLAIGERAEDVKFWFETLVRVFGAMAPDGRKLLRLSIVAARLRLLIARLAQEGIVLSSQDEASQASKSTALEAQAEALLESQIDAFADGSSLPIEKHWSHMLSEWPQGFPAPPYYQEAPRSYNGCDVDQLCATFSWLQMLEPTAVNQSPMLQQDLNEFVVALGHARQADALRRRGGDHLNPDQASHERHRVSQADFLAPKQTTLAPLCPLPFLGPATRSLPVAWLLQELLQPILQQQMLDAWMVRTTMSMLLRERLTMTPASDNLARLIKGFVDALLPPNPGYTVWDTNTDLLCTALGIDGHLLKLWTPAHSPAVKALVPVFKRVVERLRQDRDCTVHFLRFCATDAAGSIWPQTLEWIGDLPPNTWTVWGGETIPALATYLETVWRRNAATVRADAPVRERWVRLLAVGRSHQDPTAIRLSEALVMAGSENGGP